VEELILYIIKSIVSEPDSIKVNRVNDQYGKLFYEIEASKKDTPYIIGRGGSTINAIRKIVSIKNPKAYVRIKD
jgi:predicted RNA-binding protein YlqC (UPF0109 family)